MAEHVQAALDLMVAPLQDLQERGVFSAEEIRTVVTRRRDSEYALRRRQPRKADFLRYLQAEMDLEKLRQLRSKRLLKLQRQQEHDKGEKDPSQTNTKHIGDKHVIQHIHLLWVRTLRKYRADVALYLQYADFCKETGSFRKLAACYSQALQLHPKEPGLWIEAASHEFFQAGSVPAARVLLQRGLRINPTAVDLWVQYFGLELHFVQKMQGRRNILMGGGSNSVNVNVEQENDDEDEPSVDKDKEERTIPSKWDAHGMARIVYDNAIVAIPDNVAFRLRFLDQCRLFPDTVALAQHIVDSIQRDVACQGQPEAWIARAMYAWEKMSSGATGVAAATEARGFVRTTNAVSDGNESDDNDQDQEPSSKRQRSESSTAKALANINAGDPVLAVLQEATRTLQTKDMFLQAIRFLRSYMEQLETGNGADNDDDSEQEAEDRDDDNVNHQNEQRLETARTFLESLLKDAATRDFYGSDLVAAYVEYLESCEQVEDAVNVIDAFYKTKSKPAGDDKFLPAKLWTDWARLVAFSQSLVAGIGILQKGLKQIPMAEPDHIIVLLELLGAKLMAGDEEGTGDFGDVFQRILLLAPGFVEMQDIEEPSFGISNVSIACLQYLRHKINKDGVAGARVVYNAVLFQSSLGKSMGAEANESIKAFVDEAIEAEMNEDKSTAAAKNRLRRLYDAAVNAFTDTSLEDEYRRRRNEVVIYG
jgi:U3 small nucleolar RNA-associated protein 6